MKENPRQGEINGRETRFAIEGQDHRIEINDPFQSVPAVTKRMRFPDPVPHGLSKFVVTPETLSLFNSLMEKEVSKKSVEVKDKVKIPDESSKKEKQTTKKKLKNEPLTIESAIDIVENVKARAKRKSIKPSEQIERDTRGGNKKSKEAFDFLVEFQKQTEASGSKNVEEKTEKKVNPEPQRATRSKPQIPKAVVDVGTAVAGNAIKYGAAKVAVKIGPKVVEFITKEEAVKTAKAVISSPQMGAESLKALETVLKYGGRMENPVLKMVASREGRKFVDKAVGGLLGFAIKLLLGG